MKKSHLFIIEISVFLILFLCNCSKDTDNLDNPAPVINFTCSTYSGTAPQSISFTDQSINDPTSWKWDFGDGESSILQHPKHTYSTPGVYTVSLTAFNPFGSETLAKEDYIRINGAGNIPPKAYFSCNPTSGETPLIVSFTDLSINLPSTWYWEFGDGKTSTLQNPVHTYSSPGIYTVSLTVSDAYGSDKLSKPDLIYLSNQSSTKYSLVFDHDNGELCYYPRISSDGHYLVIEREQIISAKAYIAHIWLYDMTSHKVQQLTKNPTEGYYDDRNLRFTEDNTAIYFLRTCWKLDGSKEYMLCSIPVDGDENDVKVLPISGIHIYSFDLISNKPGKMIIAYYDSDQKQFYTGILDTETYTINTLQHLTGKTHTALVSMPDGSGFIGFSGLAETSNFSYKIEKHYFNTNPSEEIKFEELRHIVWTLSINPGNDKLLVHQGVCTQSLTHAIPLSGGLATPYLSEYTLPRDAIWGADNYIYFTVNGNVMRYDPSY